MAKETRHPDKLINTHEIKIGNIRYKIVGILLDNYIMYGISKSGEERRIDSWRNKEIRKKQLY